MQGVGTRATRTMDGALSISICLPLSSIVCSRLRRSLLVEIWCGEAAQGYGEQKQ